MRMSDLSRNKWIIVLITALIAAFIILLIVLLTKNGNGGQIGTENPTGNPTVINDSFGLNSFANANVGDIVKFGSYEQDNNTENGAEHIEWQVLEKRADGSLLVVSRYGLDSQPYNAERTDVTWETCTLRRWLNTTFFDTAFTSSEKSMIAKTRITNAGNIYGISGGNDTEDQVFLLSIDEAKRLFKDEDEEGRSTARACKPTEYAKAQGAYTYDSDKYYGNGWWWLRSPGNDFYGAVGVSGGGNVGDYGGYVYSSDDGVADDAGTVRPALIINP